MSEGRARAGCSAGVCDGFDWYAEEVTLVDKGQGSSADNVPQESGLAKGVSLASG